MCLGLRSSGVYTERYVSQTERQCGMPAPSASKSSRTSEAGEGVTEHGQCGVRALSQAHVNRQKQEDNVSQAEASKMNGIQPS